jgi:protein-disulfide isomerase
MNEFKKLFFYAAAIIAIAMSPAAAYGADGSSFKPPTGARVAIIVFEDLECPTCAIAYPQLWEASNKYNVPLVLHDYPIANHPWSFDAAVYARYFDTKSQKLGDDFRGYIYRNQAQIDKQNLRQHVDKFASDNKAPLPFVLDADGQLKAKVIADRELGNQIGLKGTPLIFVVGNGGASTPAVEVEDRGKLGQIIEDMLQKAPPPAPAKKAPPKKGKAAKKQAASSPQ